MTDLATTSSSGALQRRSDTTAALEKRLRTEKQLLLVPPAVTTTSVVAGTALHEQMMASLAVGGPEMLLVGLGGGVLASTVATGVGLFAMARTGTFEGLPPLKRILLGSAGSGAAMVLIGGHPLIVGGYYLAGLIGTWPWLRDRLRAVKGLRGRLAEETALEQSRTDSTLATTGKEDVVDGEIVTTAIPADLAVYVQRWADGVAKDNLAGSVLTLGRRLPDGRVSFVVQGGPGGIAEHAANAKREGIASSLKLALPHPTGGGGQTVVFDRGGDEITDQSQLRMQIINLASVAAAGSRVGEEIVSAPGNRYSVRIGGYIDDGAPAFWDLADHDGAYSGVGVAGTGMGKSSVSEQLGLRVLQFGWELGYCDPQQGASSPVLAAHAHFPALGMDAIEGFLCFLEDAADTRESWMAAHEGVGEIHPDLVAPCAPTGSHPDEDCPCGGVVPPPLVSILDECDQAFNALEAGTTRKLADRFGALAKRIRKLCMSMYAFTQIPDLKTFGGSELLRSNLPVRNLLAMHVSSNVSGTLIPGLPYSPKLLPKISGRGLMCGQASRQMQVVLDWLPRRSKSDVVAGPYAEDLFEAVTKRVAYVLDAMAAARHLKSSGPDAALRNRDDARARLRAKLNGQAAPRLVSTPPSPAPRPVMSWPAPVRTPSVMELEQMVAAPSGIVEQVLDAIRPLDAGVLLTVGELAKRLGRVADGADTTLVRVRAKDLSVELAKAGKVLPVQKRADGMSATVAEIRAALE